MRKRTLFQCRALREVLPPRGEHGKIGREKNNTSSDAGDGDATPTLLAAKSFSLALIVIRSLSPIMSSPRCESSSLILRIWLWTNSSFLFLLHRPTDLGDSVSSDDPALSWSISGEALTFSLMAKSE